MVRKHRSPRHSLLVGLGLFVILTHVCALPVHATGLAMVLEQTHGAHDERSADESMHGGSCEMVRSAFTSTPPVPPAVSAAPVGVVTHVGRPLDRPIAAVAISPPLFLLHAPLLI